LAVYDVAGTPPGGVARLSGWVVEEGASALGAAGIRVGVGRSDESQAATVVGAPVVWCFHPQYQQATNMPTDNRSEPMITTSNG
jgi:hypothetical protein